jgi:hypothetical protein
VYTFSSSLHTPDDTTWKASLGYSPTIAGALCDAYNVIRRGMGSVNAFEHAAAIVAPHLKARMSQRQRLRLYFVQTVTCAACDRFEDAIDWTDWGIDLAAQLDDMAAQCELLALRASCNRALLRFLDAISDRCSCLDLLDIQRDAGQVDDSAAELQTVAQLATYAYFAGQPLLAEGCIRKTRSLAAQVPHEDFDLASAEWVQAHLYRTYGEPERALHHALSFYNDYIREASDVSRDRLEFFLAETALDWADTLPPGTDRDALVSLSLPHLQSAERLAQESLDNPGQGLAQLARAHYDRLSGGGHMQRVAALEAVVRLGTELGDIAIVAQAYTALGDEFAARQESVSSLTCYHTTLDVLKGSQVAVLANPARRALLKFQEMNP